MSDTSNAKVNADGRNNVPVHDAGADHGNLEIHEELNSDGRERHSWQTQWPPEARKKIRVEAFYMGIVFVLGMLLLVLTWRGHLYSIFVPANCEGCGQYRFNLFAYLFVGGMFGGTLFGIKYLYKVVARGYWNEDRVLWRVFSPFLAGGLAVGIGAMLESGLLGVAPKVPSGTYFFSIGFITGYFADRALGKMQEIATTIFGTPGQG